MLKPSVIGADMLPFKIKSLKTFSGLAVTHMLVKACENGDLCLCEFSFQQQVNEQFVISLVGNRGARNYFII